MLRPSVATNPEDRMAEISRRKEKRLRIAAQVNRMYVRAVEEDDYSGMVPPGGALGCFAAIGRRVRRLFGCGTRESVGTKEPASETGMSGGMVVSSTGSQAQLTTQRSTITSALFGQRKTTSATPTARLQLAQQSIADRTIALEQRAADMRHQAQLQMKEGAKPAALRSLRRSKQLAAQAQNLAKASMAVERQADMLEEAGLQQEVAKALQAGVKDIKKVQSAMKTVESISDDASAMADDVDEINALLAQLADTGADASSIDDDELLAELQEMTGPIDPPAPLPMAQAASDQTDGTEEASKFEQVVQSMPAVPQTEPEGPAAIVPGVAPGASPSANRREEKQSLLMQASA